MTLANEKGKLHVSALSHIGVTGNRGFFYTYTQPSTNIQKSSLENVKLLM